MDLDDYELKATRGLADKEAEEEQLIKELSDIMEYANLTSDWRETIRKTIRVLGGEDD